MSVNPWIMSRDLTVRKVARVAPKLIGKFHKCMFKTDYTRPRSSCSPTGPPYGDKNIHSSNSANFFCIKDNQVKIWQTFRKWSRTNESGLKSFIWAVGKELDECKVKKFNNFWPVQSEPWRSTDPSVKQNTFGPFDPRLVDLNRPSRCGDISVQRWYFSYYKYGRRRKREFAKSWEGELPV